MDSQLDPHAPTFVRSHRNAANSNYTKAKKVQLNNELERDLSL